MDIVITWGAHVGSAPAQFQSTVNRVATFLESLFWDQVTVNITVDWGFVDGSPVSSLGASSTFYDTFSYDGAVRAALINDAHTAIDAQSLSSLPNLGAGTPTVAIASAAAHALGLTSITSVDGYCGFDSSVSWDWDNSNGVTPGSYDVFGVILHEMTENLGRFSFVDGVSTISQQDLFRFSSSGTHQYTTGSPAYFSINNGASNLGNWNTTNGGDYGDWASSVGADMGLAFGSSGVIEPFTTRDVINMDVIGYNYQGVNRDFNLNTISDILWRNPTTGITGYFQMTAGGFNGGWHDIGGSSTSYSIVGSGDFNYDGVADVLWRDNSTGITGYYQMNSSGNLVGWRDIGGSSTAYTVVGVGDFNGDHVSDVLWRDNFTGLTGYFQMNSSGNLVGWRDIGGSSTAYTIKGVGDFNGDYVSDILWRNDATGTTGYYQMNSSGNLVGWRDIGGSSVSYSIVGVGDFNGDHVSDVLWRNNSTGVTGYYQMNSAGNLVGWHDVGGSSTTYTVVGTGDYNGDGISDVLWRNSSTGVVGYYQMDVSGNLQGWHDIAGSSTAYLVF
jgi:hypothetical protein